MARYDVITNQTGADSQRREDISVRLKMKKLYLQPKTREPFFTGYDTESAKLDSGCPHCQSRIVVEFKQMLNAAWGWEHSLGDELANELADVFGIILSSSSLNTQMAGVVAQQCLGCDQTNYFHFDFRETSNSVYSISLRAAATDG